MEWKGWIGGFLLGIGITCNIVAMVLEPKEKKIESERQEIVQEAIEQYKNGTIKETIIINGSDTTHVYKLAEI